MSSSGNREVDLKENEQRAITILEESHMSEMKEKVESKKTPRT